MLVQKTVCSFWKDFDFWCLMPGSDRCNSSCMHFRYRADTLCMHFDWNSLGMKTINKRWRVCRRIYYIYCCTASIDGVFFDCCTAFIDFVRETRWALSGGSFVLAEVVASPFLVPINFIFAVQSSFVRVTSIFFAFEPIELAQPDNTSNFAVQECKRMPPLYMAIVLHCSRHETGHRATP